MAEFVIPAPTPASVAVQGNPARFPVRRIFCVGRNYAEHAREFGNDPDKEPPFFFTKPADAVIDNGFTLPYPSATNDLHFEGELVVAIGKGGANIPETAALSHIWGYAPGNDLTRRDLQATAKTMKRPWDMSKGFDRSAPCGALVPVATAGHPPADAVLTCTVNGAVKQKAKLADMIWPVPAIIAFLSQQVELHPGDLIYTGTPAGVGALQRGDSCEVSITGLGSVTTSIA